MIIEQIYTGCLAQGTYYIESQGEAAIIDPLREVDTYVTKALQGEAKIKYIFETHFHADFVSGHVDLAAKTGGKIVFGPYAETLFDSHIAQDGELFEIGALSIKLLHTPGHTMESSTYLLYDETGKEHAIFSGDTLFIGDVGRPDLAISSNLTKEDLASHLYSSLRTKIMTLPDDIIVYPAHGAGSACGKNMSKETWDTLGHQKEVNYALREDMTEQEFVKEVTEGIASPPQYFAKNAMMNKSGYEAIDQVLKTGLVPLDVVSFESLINNEEALVLDTRHQNEFVKGHIPNSIFIGIDGGFAPWVGALILDLKQPIVFIANVGKEEEVVKRLSRVGYDNTLGYLKGGIDAWKEAGKDLEIVRSISAEDFESELNGEEIRILDVRKPEEYTSEHIEKSEPFALDFINNQMYILDPRQHYYIHCAGGYRSVIASSILKSRGFHNLTDVAGGFTAIKQTGIKKTGYVCPTTLK